MKSHGLDVHLTSHDWYLDITPKGDNKATAIHHLLKQHDLSVDESVRSG
ncbi:HAD hydrolase family protein [Vibrio lentus]|nr:HAD hydrolase family protein [Vibrio lentus]